MATGIPSKNHIAHKINTISVSYEGKRSVDDILHQPHSVYQKQLSVNGGTDSCNHLYFGDNLDALLFLLDSGYKEKVNLIYIDPPFATNSDFVSREQNHAYSDLLTGSDYVEFLRERLVVLHELLASTGSIYVHLDNKMAFTIKLIMDEIFGEDNFRAFITRKKCSTKNYTKNTYGNISDYIMFYTKSDVYTWNRPYEPWDLERMLEEYPYIDEKTGKRYKKVPIHAPGNRNGETGKEWHGMLPPPGKHWQYTPQKLDELEKKGEIYWSQTGNPRRKVFCEPQKGIPIQDIWLDYRDSINQAQRTTGYPTEKNMCMLKTIVQASSNLNDIVLDCFAGSGSSLGAAYDCGRAWIGIDNSLESMKAISKRFISGMKVYGDYVNQEKQEHIQPQFDFIEKCAFDVFCSYEDKDISTIFQPETAKQVVNA